MAHRASATAPIPGPTVPARVDLARGTVVGNRYRILRSLGCGAMSRVYLAEHQAINRLVALKIIHRDRSQDRPTVIRFQREARLLARVDHPNIVTVHDLGKTRAGEQYIVMEYVGGRTLGQLIRKHGRLTPTRTISLLLQIARAMAAVHEVGIIHRDLKPDNVLIVKTKSGVEVVKVADFGLAKAVSSRRDDNLTDLTRDGFVVGTPEFMAPEQAAGGEVDPRADIYSMGCIAYEMLTGRPPFIGEEIATMLSQLHTEPAPLRNACPEAEIPPAFQKFIDRVLAKDPERRYRNMLQLYSGLLKVSDRARIERRDLRLVQSLFDDPAYAKSHEASGRVSPTAAPPVEPKRSGLETILLVCVLITIILGIGVALGRIVS